MNYLKCPFLCLELTGDFFLMCVGCFMRVSTFVVAALLNVVAPKSKESREWDSRCQEKTIEVSK